MKLLNKIIENPFLKGRKLQLLFTFFISIFLVSCSNNIDLVKDGFLEDYKSLTIGQAFDNYSGFSETNWEKFETQNGTNVVEFNGTFKEASSDSIKVICCIQFTINMDDSFEITSGQIEGYEKGKLITSSNLRAGSLDDIYLDK